MRNFASKLAGEAGVRIFSSLFIFILGRNLGAAPFGLYSTAFAFASLFMILVDMGINPIVTREIARDVAGRPRLIHSATLLKLAASVLALIGIHVVALRSHFDVPKRHLVDALGVVVVTYALADYMGALLSGKEEMGWEAFLKVLCRGVVVVTGLGVLYATQSLMRVAAAMAGASVISLLAGGFIVRARFGTLEAGYDPAVVMKLVRSSLPLLGSIVFWVFYDNQDILILNHFHVPDREIGLFWSATKVIDVLKVLPVLLSGAFFPAMARFTAARESYIQTTRALLFYALAGVPLVIGLSYAAAPRIETLLYGRQFLEAAPYLRILLIAYFGICMNHIGIQILITRDREKKLLPGAMIACLSNVALSWYWIPRVGTIGACYALVASETFYFLFQAKLILEAVPGLLTPFRRTFG